MVTLTIGQANPKPKIHMKTIELTIGIKLWDTIQPNFKKYTKFQIWPKLAFSKVFWKF